MAIPHFTFLGTRSVDFTNDQGKKISGFTLFFAYPDSLTSGMACDKKFIPFSSGLVPPSSFPVDGVIYFDRKGKVVALDY